MSAFQLLAGLLEHAPSVIYACAPDGRYRVVNLAWEELTGLSREQVIGRTRTEVWGAELARRFDECDRETIRIRGPVARDERVEMPFGDRHFQTVRFPVFAEDGSVALVAGVCVDITELREAERSLQQRARLVDLSHDAIITCDGERRIVLWNEGAREMYGWSEREARGQVIHNLLRTEMPSLEQIDRELRCEGRWEGELSHTTRDGRRIVVESRHVSLRREDGSSDGFLEINRDITDRKRAEAALSQRDEMLRLATSSARIVAWDWNIRTGEVFCTGGCHHLAGPETAPGSRGFLQCVQPEDRECVGRELRAAVDADRDLYFEYRTAKPGEDRWFAITGAVCEREDGAPVRMTGIIQDITDRKREEKAARERQKLESIGMLAGGIAHDFNNLLTGVLGNASLALEEAPPGPVRTCLEGIEHAAERAAHLTRQLLAYSGKGQFVVEPVSLSALAGATAELLRSSVPRSIDLRLELADNLPLIAADAAQMQQVLMNLVSNAVEAIGSRRVGTITVRVSAMDAGEEELARYSGEPLPPGRFVSLDVSDTGEGMNEETCARMFDPFFTTRFTGRGLGLSAVQGIVRGHRGAIRVESAPRKGSSFRILFPIAEGKAPAMEQPRPAAQARGAILVVDDEELVRDTAKSILERLGYRVMVAANGREALDALRAAAEPVSLILLDMAMPVMDGARAIGPLKTIAPDVPILVTSGYSREQAAERFRDKGAADFIQKPFSIQGLAEAVASALAKRQRQVSSIGR